MVTGDIALNGKPISELGASPAVQTELKQGMSLILEHVVVIFWGMARSLHSQVV